METEDAAFASNLDDMIERWQPALWVHGHIHTAVKYRIVGTRIVCNPRGYEAAGWYEKTGWQEDLVIEI